MASRNYMDDALHEYDPYSRSDQQESRGQRSMPPSKSTPPPSASRSNAGGLHKSTFDADNPEHLAQSISMLARSQDEAREMMHRYVQDNNLQELKNYVDAQLAQVARLPYRHRELPTFHSSFSGEPSDVASEFLDELEHWRTYHRLDEDDVIHLLPTLLTGRAKRWYMDLPDNISSDYKLCKTKLADSFQPDVNAQKYTDVVEDRKQRPDETVLSYATEMRKLSRLANLSSHDSIGFFIRGLIPPLKHKMKLETYQSITEAENAALKFETQQAGNTYTMRAEMSRLEGMMTKMMEKVLPKEQATPTIATIAPDPATSAMYAEVCNLRADIASLQNDRSQGAPQRAPYDNRYQQSPPGPLNYYNNQRPRGYQNKGGRPFRRCNNCDRVGHDDGSCSLPPYCPYCRVEGHSKSTCKVLPAKDPRNVVCYTCDRVGHYARDCPRAQGNA